MDRKVIGIVLPAVKLLGLAYCVVAMTGCARPHPPAAIANPPPPIPGGTGSLLVTVHTDDPQPVPVRLELRTGHADAPVATQTTENQKAVFKLPITGRDVGQIYLMILAPGYATQWERVMVDCAGGFWPGQVQIRLFRKRYAVLRYAFNPTNHPELTGKDVVTGRVAVAHWGHLPFFGDDWQIWQGFGDGTLYLQFHRISARGFFGFADPPPGKTFDDLKRAPTRRVYQTENRPIVKGQLLYCRVNANRPDNLGYGKILVEDLTTEPPSDLPLLEGSDD